MRPSAKRRCCFIWNLNLVPRVFCGEEHGKVNTAARNGGSKVRLLTVAERIDAWAHGIGHYNRSPAAVMVFTDFVLLLALA